MLLSDVPGATPWSICQELFVLAAKVQPELAIVEIGVYLARSLCYLGAGSQRGYGAQVFGIDPWDLPGERLTFEQARLGQRPEYNAFTDPQTKESAKRHVAECGLTELVTLIRGFASDVGRDWSGPEVGLLYVDGDHHHDVIVADFFAWRPHLQPGSIVAFDDCAEPFVEVMSAVEELVRERELSEPLVLHGRLAVTRVR